MLFQALMREPVTSLNLEALRRVTMVNPNHLHLNPEGRHLDGDEA
ncbi:hypothetical protein [Microvirga makkahensis]|nr:hypothetical protein [Microvirga makkahensis]